MKNVLQQSKLMTIVHRNMKKIGASLLLGITLIVSGCSSVNSASVQQKSSVPFTLPKPTGSHAIGTTELHLVDKDRLDPWVKGVKRELMVSVWYPAKKGSKGKIAPYMQPKTADSLDHNVAPSMGLKPGQIDWSSIKTHAVSSAPVERKLGKRPIVLYSPGFGVSRTAGTNTVENLVSHGYVVVTMDHTYETNEVEFPGGRLTGNKIPENMDPIKRKETYMKVRMQDTRFVLDQLALLQAGKNPDAEQRKLPHGIQHIFDLSQVGMFGHSAGGDTAANTMYVDKRIDAGIDMDGFIGYDELTGKHLTPVAKNGLNRPFLLMGAVRSDGQSRTHQTTPAWQSFWKNSIGWKLDLNVPNGRHYTFTDHQVILPQIAKAFDLPEKTLDLFANQMIGTVEPKRIVASQRSYILAFFDQHLKHKHQRLLDGPSKHHPDVKFIK